MTLTAAALYATGITFTKTTLTNVETIDLSDGGTYRFTLNDANNSGGLTINGSTLTGTNILVVNGAAETSAGLTAFGGAGNDSLVGGKGSDVLEGGAGNDTLTGGDGADFASYESSLAGVTVNLNLVLQGGGGDAAGDRLSKIENLKGSTSGDALTGDKNSNILLGLDGDDLLLGGAGADILDGGADTDTASYAGSTKGVLVSLEGGGGVGGDANGDILIGIENLIGSSLADTFKGDDKANKLDGAAGNDLLIGGKGADTLEGGLGIDTADYSLSDKAVTVDLSNNANNAGGHAAGDELSNVENVIGTEFSDTLTGDGLANQLEGREGNDDLDGGAGNDILIGGSGQDALVAGSGNDTLKGDEGNDDFDLGANLNAADKIDGGVGTDELTLSGDYSAGVVFGATTVVNIESIIVQDGGSYNLKLANITNALELAVDGTALTGSNALILDGSLETANSLIATGGAGNDALIGGGGTDTLDGGEGDDTLNGGANSDVLKGGAGADSMTGGLGIDIVSYETSAEGVTVDLSNNANNAGGDAAGDKLSLVENLLGSEHDDNLTGDVNANVLEGGKGADTMAGGSGIDTASYAGSDAGVTVDLANSANNAGGDAAGDVLSGFENLIGSAQDDDLRGDNGNNRIDGGSGFDTLTAGAGNDTLLGGDGWDTFMLAGNLTKDDRIDGGGGSNTLVLAGNYAAGLTFTATTAVSIDDIVLADGNSYTLKLANSTNSKTLTVDGGDLTGANRLVLDGSAESFHDLFAFGGAANDTITGGGGGDILNGGAGADKLTGNGGGDTASYLGSSAGVTVNLNIKGAQAARAMPPATCW